MDGLVDSEATNHMASKHEVFTDMKKHDENIYVANVIKLMRLVKEQLILNL